MNSNVSPVSAAQVFQRQSKLNPSARLGIEALVGIGAPGSNAPSFSNTLKQQQQQQQLRDQGVYEPEEDTTNVVDEQKDAEEEGEQDTDEEK